MEDEKYRAAKAQVAEIKGFYSHLGIYIGINLMLIAINLITSPDHLWFYWITLFWGIFVIWNGISVFSKYRIFSKEWEEKKIREIMEKDEELK